MQGALAQRLDLQARISLVLVAVIVPTFLLVTITQNQFMKPVLEEELKQAGITAGRNLANEILTAKLLTASNSTAAVEAAIQEMVFSHPNVQRVDVAVRDAAAPGGTRVIGSNVEEDPTQPHTTFAIVDEVTSEYKQDDDTGLPYWEISVPLEIRSKEGRLKKATSLLGKNVPNSQAPVGVIHMIITTRLVGRVISTLWRTTSIAAGISVVALILALRFFLRRTIENDRLLRRAESENVQLIAQLQEAQRQLMNTEKVAVMGQLTASFAHEIGTPLNATGGHLQLLREELKEEGAPAGQLDRLEIINSQLMKMEQIVKGFLQSTAKPASQRQLVDVNLLAEKTLGIAGPQLQALGVEVIRKLDRHLGPLRLVPLDIEQIFLNLVNNSIDSLKAKSHGKKRGGRDLELKFETKSERIEGRTWASFSVFDTGEGISKDALSQVLKPFFTTKRPGEGTGLGLTICRQLAQKYGGELDIDSKEGAWTQVTVRLPFEGNT